MSYCQHNLTFLSHFYDNKVKYDSDKLKMNWENAAKNILKSELKKRGMNYEQLRDKLAAIGVHESAYNINRKINRGAFRFIFFLQCASAIGLKILRLEEFIAYQIEGE